MVNNIIINLYNINFYYIIGILLLINIFFLHHTILDIRKSILLFIIFISINTILINILTNNFIWFFFFMIYIGGIVVYLIIFLFSLDHNHILTQYSFKNFKNIFTFEYLCLNFILILLFSQLNTNQNKVIYFQFNNDNIKLIEILHNLFENHVELFFLLGLILMVVTISLTTIFKI